MGSSFCNLFLNGSASLGKVGTGCRTMLRLVSNELSSVRVGRFMSLHMVALATSDSSYRPDRIT